MNSNRWEHYKVIGKRRCEVIETQSLKLSFRAVNRENLAECPSICVYTVASDR